MTEGQHLSALLEVGREPFETFVKAVSAGSARGLNEPLSLSQAVQAELVSNLCRVHGVGQILLVGKDEKKSVAKLIFVEHSLQFFACLRNSLSIVGINDEDDAVRVLEVMSPERSNFVLSSNVPNGEGNVLVLDRLDIETNGGNGGDDLTELKLVENRGLTGGIESDHENSHLLFAKEAREQLGN